MTTLLTVDVKPFEDAMARFRTLVEGAQDADESNRPYTATRGLVAQGGAVQAPADDEDMPEDDDSDDGGGEDDGDDDGGDYDGDDGGYGTPFTRRGLYFFPEGEIFTGFDDGAEFLQEINLGYESLPMWNAHAHGAWIGSTEAGWGLLAADLVSEQDEGEEDPLSVLIAAWQVTGGHAMLVVPQGPKNEQIVASMLGLAEYPTDGWQQIEGWYGE